MARERCPECRVWWMRWGRDVCFRCAWRHNLKGTIDDYAGRVGGMVTFKRATPARGRACWCCGSLKIKAVVTISDYGDHQYPYAKNFHLCRACFKVVTKTDDVREAMVLSIALEDAGCGSLLRR